MTLTTENATNAAMPTGLKYGQRCDWIAKRDALVRGASAAPVVASEDTATLIELEAAAGCNHFDRLDSAADAPKPIWINTKHEAAFAVTCIRRNRARRAA